MRTKQKYMKHKGYLIRADESESVFWFNYANKQRGTIAPFGQPVADDTSTIKSTTQLPFAVDDLIKIKDETSRIIEIDRKALNENISKRSFNVRYEYTIKLT